MLSIEMLILSISEMQIRVYTFPSHTSKHPNYQSIMAFYTVIKIRGGVNISN